MVCFCLLCSVVWTGQPTIGEVEKGKREILIGSHLPLSGAGAAVGAEQKWAYERAVEDVNKAGGIFVKEYGGNLPVRLIMMDDESDFAKAGGVVERLITQTKVDLLLSGQVGAMGVLPGMITAEKYHKYYHGSVIWVPDFLKYNFKWCTMYFFDMGQGGAMYFEVMNSLPEEERPERPAVFVEDSFDGKQMGDFWERLAEKYGHKIVLREVMGMGAKDFSSQIIRAKSMGVDAIILMASVPETVTLVRQMKEVNFSVKFFHGMKGTWARSSMRFWEKMRNISFAMDSGLWIIHSRAPKSWESATTRSPESIQWAPACIMPFARSCGRPLRRLGHWIQRKFVRPF